MVRVHVIATQSDFLDACERLAKGSGSFAIDAERASGFTYSQRAYLIQIYRREAGTFLFDAPALGDMSALNDVADGHAWILHAASQDLACLREVGITPTEIFDTELAARLLGMEKVGLGAVVAELLDVHLAKEHSAVDWSTRPLPEPWLEYAALDVELLVDLQDKMIEMLEAASKSDIARQEFHATLTKPDKESSDEPWRRLSGLHSLRTPRAVAVARSLWLERDRIARDMDVASGRLIPDSSIIAAVVANPSTKAELAALKAFHGRASRTMLDSWWEAIQRGQRDEDLPVLRVKSTQPPPPRSWPDRNPPAHERLVAAKPLVAQAADALALPVENLLTPSILRSLAWQPPEPVTTDSIHGALLSCGARAWQADVCAELIAHAFHESESISD